MAFILLRQVTGFVSSQRHEGIRWMLKKGFAMNYITAWYCLRRAVLGNSCDFAIKANRGPFSLCSFNCYNEYVKCTQHLTF